MNCRRVCVHVSMHVTRCATALHMNNVDIWEVASAPVFVSLYIIRGEGFHVGGNVVKIDEVQYVFLGTNAHVRHYQTVCRQYRWFQARTPCLTRRVVC